MLLVSGATTTLRPLIDLLERHGRLLRDLSEQRRLTLDTLAAEDRTS